MKTKISIDGNKFLINGKLTYSELENANPGSIGLLWNMRLIQGIFDDLFGLDNIKKLCGTDFDPEKNTDDLIAALPEWYAYGIRAITVGLQGGWPVTQAMVDQFNCNPFGEDGLHLDKGFASRLDRLIRAADEIGMIIIVNILYWAQANRLKNGTAVRNAVKTACHFLRDNKYTNVLIDVANEFNIRQFKHPMIGTEDGIAALVDLAKEESGGILTGSSPGSHTLVDQVVGVSDFVLIHLNGATRTTAYQMLKNPSYVGKPVVCNEANPCCTRVDVCLDLYASFGYYNNYTKQLLPSDWRILPGEDLFFARRVARAVGIPVEPLANDDKFVLQGLGQSEGFGFGRHVVRVACEYPEEVSQVTFYRNGEKLDISYDEPFFLNTETNWLAKSETPSQGDVYKAEIKLRCGETITREVVYGK
ncbi:MAG: hypothetical protein FWH01_16145 [Oscillospiraceae bacterium]|nr:hypothetical protein [Oscillospiraceae bacterium]